jgi:uncharacterized protein
LTKRCNLKCSYCFVDKDSAKTRESDVSSLKRAINFFLAPPNSYKTISFNGGEPIVRFGKVRKLYQYIQNQNNEKTKLVVAVMSNGTLLNKSRYEFLKKNRIILKVSIDGRKKIHDYNRPFKLKRYGSSYDRIVSNLRQFHNHESGEHKVVCASLVFTPVTVKNLLDNIRSLWKLGFDYIDFYPDLYGQWSQGELNNTESAFREFSDFYCSIFESAQDRASVFGNSLLHTFVAERDLYKPILCGKVHLDWNGNFYYCDKVFSLPETKRKEFVIGDSHKGFDNRLRLRLLKQKRNELKKITGKDCSLCKYVKYCFCPVGHYIYFSAQGLDFKQYFPQFCSLSQIYIRSFLGIIRKLKQHPLFVKSYGFN